MTAETVSTNVSYPDSAVGRRLEAQQNMVIAIDAVAKRLETEEATKEALRIKRYLGFAEKSGRGRKPADKPETHTGPVPLTAEEQKVKDALEARKNETPKAPTATGTATAPRK